jgi:hypothetical protein
MPDLFLFPDVLATDCPVVTPQQAAGCEAHCAASRSPSVCDVRAVLAQGPTTNASARVLH